MSPKTPSKANENIREFNRGSTSRGNTDETFSIGQTLRNRVGPLKGHLCHVMAIHPSHVIVKIDSQKNLVSVKREDLSEGSMKSVRILDSNSVKAFDEPQTQQCSMGKDERGDAWGSWETPEKYQNLSWSKPDAEDKPFGYKLKGKCTENWNNFMTRTSFGSNSWGKEKFPGGVQGGCSRDVRDNWASRKDGSWNQGDFKNDTKNIHEIVKQRESCNHSEARGENQAEVETWGAAVKSSLGQQNTGKSNEGTW
ncbi:hypothetical protein GIB67_000315, partial [Kingdonia uniflora]